MSYAQAIAAYRKDAATALDALTEVFGVPVARLRRASLSARTGHGRRLDGTRVLWRFHGAGVYARVHRDLPVNFDFSRVPGTYVSSTHQLESCRGKVGSGPDSGDLDGLHGKFEFVVDERPVSVLGLISRFLSAQRYVITWLSAYGVPPNVTDAEWMSVHRERVCAMRGEQADGVRVFGHGAGVAFHDDILSIDFDFPSQGHPRGFNADRLAKFAAANGIRCEAESRNDLHAALSSMSARGVLAHSGYIDYFMMPSRR